MAKPQQSRSVEIIELSSDSEADDMSQQSSPKETRWEKPKHATLDYEGQPLLRVKGIKYKTERPPETQRSDVKLPADLPVRAKSMPVKDTGSTRHRHVNIEIPLPTSSMRAAMGKTTAAEIPDSEEDEGADGEDENEGGEEVTESTSEIFKTPKEHRKHITFDDSENDEFLTPMEAPQSNPLELAPPRATDSAKTGLDAVQEEREDEQSSEDEAPEAVSSHAAGAQLANASRAAMKAAKQQSVEKKRKRQERDAFFKQQAEEKRKLRKPAAKPQHDLYDEELNDASRQPFLFSEKRKRDMPELLPMELLESDESGDDGQPTKAAKRQKSQRDGPSWLAEPKGPRDQKVGSTVFRVVDKRRNGKLAPRASARSVNLKRALLTRNRTAVPAKKGFFVKSA